MQKIKVGFIGFGKSANRYHLPFINQEKYQIIGYYKRTNTQFSMLYPNVGALIHFPTIAELLASPVDLVVVTSPAPFHFEHAKLALKARKHVLIEKPVCNTAKEYQELIELADKNKVKLQVYQNRRFDQDFVTFKAVLENALVGIPLEIESNHTDFRTDNLTTKGSKYDGFVYGHAVHFIDQIVSVFGKPEQIISDIRNQRAEIFQSQLEGKLPEDYYDIKLIYQKLSVRIRFSQLIYHHPPRFIINGSKGCYESYGIEPAEAFLKKGIFPGMTTYQPQLNNGKLYFSNKSEEVEMIASSYEQYYNQLYLYLQEAGKIVVSHNDVLNTLMIMEKIMENRN